MPYDIRVHLSPDEKSKVEIEAKKLGVTRTAFFRLLLKNWTGEISLERKEQEVSSQ